jgi:hypothetical protein
VTHSRKDATHFGNFRRFSPWEKRLSDGQVTSQAECDFVFGNGQQIDLSAGLISGMFRHLHTVLPCTWLEAYTAVMPRKLVWIEKQNFQGFGCAECNRLFKPSGVLVRESLDEMMQK